MFTKRVHFPYGNFYILRHNFHETSSKNTCLAFPPTSFLEATSFFFFFLLFLQTKDLGQMKKKKKKKHRLSLKMCRRPFCEKKEKEKALLLLPLFKKTRQKLAFFLFFGLIKTTAEQVLRCALLLQNLIKITQCKMNIVRL